MKKLVAYLRFWHIVFRVLFFCFQGLVMGLFGSRTKFFRKHIPTSGRSILEGVGSTLVTTGTEHLDPEKNYLFMGNHRSYTDILALFVGLGEDKRSICFMSKKEVFYIPLLGASMKAMGMIGVERGNSKKALKSLLDAVKLVKAGADLVIFPEGTRSIDGKLNPLKKGSFTIAVRSDVEVVPFILRGTEVFMPKGEFAIYPADVTLTILPPVPVSGRKDTEVMADVEAALQNELQK